MWTPEAKWRRAVGQVGRTDVVTVADGKVTLAAADADHRAELSAQGCYLRLGTTVAVCRESDLAVLGMLAGLHALTEPQRWPAESWRIEHLGTTSTEETVTLRLGFAPLGLRYVAVIAPDGAVRRLQAPDIKGELRWTSDAVEVWLRERPAFRWHVGPLHPRHVLRIASLDVASAMDTWAAAAAARNLTAVGPMELRWTAGDQGWQLLYVQAPVLALPDAPPLPEPLQGSKGTVVAAPLGRFEGVLSAPASDVVRGLSSLKVAAGCHDLQDLGELPAGQAPGLPARLGAPDPASVFILRKCSP